MRLGANSSRCITVAAAHMLQTSVSSGEAGGHGGGGVPCRCRFIVENCGHMWGSDKQSHVLMCRLDERCKEREGSCIIDAAAASHLKPHEHDGGCWCSWLLKFLIASAAACFFFNTYIYIYICVYIRCEGMWNELERYLLKTNHWSEID